MTIRKHGGVAEVFRFSLSVGERKLIKHFVE
jgi:hypothetical protein